MSDGKETVRGKARKKLPAPYKIKRPPVPEDTLRGKVARHAFLVRHKLELTQAEMAQRTGIIDSTIGGIERGEQNVTLDTLESVAKAYGVDVHDLICGPDYQVKQTTGLTLDVLARITGAIDARVQHLLREKGPVTVEKATLASIVGALFDALANGERHAAASVRVKAS